jgi:hypothetical protein
MCGARLPGTMKPNFVEHVRNWVCYTILIVSFRFVPSVFYTF